MYFLDVLISKDVLNKLLANKKVTVSVVANGIKVRFEFNESQKKTFQKFKRNIKNNKGTRLKLDEMVDILFEEIDYINGGSIFKSIKRGFQKFGKQVKNTAKKAEKIIKKSADFVAKNAGDAVESVKDVIPPGVAKQLLQGLTTAGITATAMALGQPELIGPLNALASQGVNMGVNTFYANDFSEKQTKQGALRALKQGAKETAKEAVTSTVKDALKPSAVAPQNNDNVTVGQGYGKKKPANKKKSQKGTSMLPLSGGSMMPLKGKGGKINVM